MKMSGLFGIMFVLSFLGHVSVAADVPIPHNDDLGDVMFMISDQAGGLATFAKLDPTQLSDADSDKAFDHALARPRGAKFLISVILERKGKVVAGRIVKDSLTPGIFTILVGADLDQAVAGFELGMNSVVSQFEDIGKEIQKQADLPKAQRSFRDLKKLLAKLDDTEKANHDKFKPKP